jgi:DNA-binding IclR family transcriptional regulator
MSVTKSDAEPAIGGSRALERGLSILGLFSSHENSLTVKEISKRIRVPIATTYRLVRSLVDLGYLDDRRGSGGEIQLGLEIVRLAAVANAGNDILSVGQQELRRLVQATGETAVLLVPGEWSATCVGMMEGTSSIRPRSARVGESVPYNAGAIPLTVLAYADTEFRSRIIGAGLHGFTAVTPTEPAAVEKECARVRGQGYAWSEGEYVDGTAASGAPIFDSQGKIAGAIGVTGITDNVVGTEHEVQAAAATITLRLGGRPATGLLGAAG